MRKTDAEARRGRTVAARFCGDSAGVRRSCRIQNRRYDDRLCRVRFYAINRRRTARRACARARRRRRAIDDGLGATSYPVQSLDRAGNLGPGRTSCEGCHVSECGTQDRSKIAVQRCRDTLVSADGYYRVLPGEPTRLRHTKYSWKKAPNNLETHICCSLLLKDPGES